MGEPENITIWTVVLVMLVAGVLGGVVNVAISGSISDRRTWVLSIISGVGASLLIPLFLQTVSSNLLTNILAGNAKKADVLVLGSFCLLASISSKAFIQTLSDRVLREAREAKQRAERTEAQYLTLRDESRQTAALAEAAHDVASLGVRAAEESRELSVDSFPKIEPGEVQDDPWAGQFGGSPVSGSRVLSAEINPVPGRPEWCTVRLTVSSSDPADPLVGPVQFYLHPTFANNKPIIGPSGGVAKITIISWGAFVVGALTDGGKHRLELDLASHPMAQEPWRSR